MPTLNESYWERMIKTFFFAGLFLVLSLFVISCAGKEMARYQPGDAEIYYKSGHAFLERNQFDLAQNEFRKALKINPQHTEALHESAIVHLRKGELDEAEIKLKRVIQIKPDLAGPHRSLGTIYLAKKLTDQAISEFKQAVQLDPLEFNSHYLLGKAFLEKGIEELAIIEFQEAAKLHAGFTEAHRELALAYHKKGHETYEPAFFDKAIQEIKTVLSISPVNREAHALLGELYLDTGTYSLAIFEFQEALRSESGPASVFRDLAFAFAANNYFDQAIEKLHVYRGLVSENAEGYRNLGHIYYILKEDHLAISFYRQALGFDSKSDAALWLYLTLMRNARQEEAIGILQKYSQGFQDSRWQANLARYLITEKKTGEYVLPEERQHQGCAFFFLGSYYLANGDKDTAREYLLAGAGMKFFHGWEYLAARKALEDLETDQ